MSETHQPTPGGIEIGRDHLPSCDGTGASCYVILHNPENLAGIWAQEAETWGQETQEFAERGFAAGAEAWDQSLSLVEQADRDHPAEMAAARARRDRMLIAHCPYGNCVLDILDGCIDGGCGPIGCPCDLTPGWRSKRLDGMGKPHPPVLPKGRHASRVRRARKRHQLPE